MPENCGYGRSDWATEPLKVGYGFVNPAATAAGELMFGIQQRGPKVVRYWVGT